MRALLAAALAWALGAAAWAQPIPDSFRSAGVTTAQWEALQQEIARVSAERGASQLALRAIAERLTGSLSQDGRIDLDRLTALIDERAVQLQDLQQRLAAFESADDPQVAALVTRARESIERGDLQGGDDFLAQAADADLAAAARAEASAGQRRERAARTHMQRAQLASVSGDFAAARALYDQAAAAAPQEGALQTEILIDRADVSVQEGYVVGDAAAIRNAIVGLRAAAERLDRASNPAQWTRTQAAIAHALTSVGDLAGDRSAYTDAAAVAEGLVQSLAPETSDWFDAQLALGTALTGLGVLGDTDALQRGIEALRIARRTDDWETRMGAGQYLVNALTYFGAYGYTNILEEAVSTADEILAEFGDGYPLVRASALNNRGTALLRAAELNYSLNGTHSELEPAIASFEQALALAHRDIAPNLWARGMNNLGLAYERRGEFTGDSENFHRAIEAFEAAQTIITSTDAPVSWALTQNNIGLALMFLNTPASLTRAISVLQAALDAISLDLTPAGWGMSQQNLANVHYRRFLLGERNALQAAHRAALEAERAYGLAGNESAVWQTQQIRARIEQAMSETR
ncbi:MAG: hypothetical protein AB7P07_05900 [Hyphomonadaceae bacterium]